MALDVSPTGRPLIAPSAVPVLAAVWAGVVAAVQALPEGPVQHWATVGLAALGPILSMFSPGLRSKT